MDNVNWARLTPHSCWNLVNSEAEFLLLGFWGVQACIRYWRGVNKKLGLILSNLDAILRITLPLDPESLLVLDESPKALLRPLTELTKESRSLRSSFLEQRKRIECTITFLEKQQKRADRTPLLPQLRPSNWFAEEEAVVVLKKAASLHFRARTGVVSFVGNGYSITVNLGPYSPALAGNDPRLLHTWEWTLLTNSDRLRKFWLDKAVKIKPEFAEIF